MSETVRFVLGLAVVAVAIVLVARKIDVRLVLFLGALALGGLAGDVTPIVRIFLQTLSNEQFVLPICTAMGFAQVLRHSGCDQHLIHLLVRPIRTVRPLLIPGAVLIGFIVNASVISQASTAVAVGTVLVPLLRSARLTPVTIGSALLLGSSLGGELVNPGAPELNTVASEVKRVTGVKEFDSTMVVEHVWPLLLVQLAIATGLFWLISARADRQAAPDEPIEETATESKFRINLFKAVVPVVPLVLLMTIGPPLELLTIPRRWLVVQGQGGEFGTRLIGASMLFGTALAALASPRKATDAARVFFEGAGLALTRIVSVIVTAQCFGEGIKQLHLEQPIRELIAVRPELVWLVSAGVTLAFAALCGSGMAATQTLYGLYINSEMSLGLMLPVGAVTSIAAAAGRTMTPVAAVVLTSAELADSKPLTIARRVVAPLLAATVITVLVAWYRGS
jgi:DcuC family C4-dicarboxylate transporter